MANFSDTVVVFAGLDPSAGAGLSADIESINQFGIVALPIATILTAQNSAKITKIVAVSSNLIAEQFNLLYEDIKFQVIKIGAMASTTQIDVINKCINKKANMKIVVDPIIFSSSGKRIMTDKMLIKMRKKIIPKATIITPNKSELEMLAPNLAEKDAVTELKCSWTLVTSAQQTKDTITHKLYKKANLYKTFKCNKLDKQYHGSGCTLASAISALLAIGYDVDIACKNALEYCYQTLLNAKKIGKIQYNPIRHKP